MARYNYHQVLSRRAMIAGSIVGLAALAVPQLSACGQAGTSSGDTGTGSSTAGSSGATGSSGASGSNASGSAASSASTSSASSSPRTKVTVGTLATEDILPYWVAQQGGLIVATQPENLFEQAGLDVEIVLFQSATELIAGIASKTVDIAMTDPMVTASLFAGGTDVQMLWVTLGTTPQQGRFGIMAHPDSGLRTLEDLAGVPIGAGSNTILEYVMDTLLADAGVPDDQIKVAELQKLPVRYQALASGEVEAAALPGSLLALGEAQGLTLIADDTTGNNISQSVMIGQHGFVTAHPEAIEGLKQAWDVAVALIDASPEDYRGCLVANANLSDEVAATYPISQYPSATLPTAAMIDPVLAWMRKKNYLTRDIAYDESTGAFSLV